jgi:hypothetical protein
MDSKIVFIIKIAIASLFLSALIKYGGQTLPISATNSIALILVLLPSIILGIIFGFRYQKLNG